MLLSGTLDSLPKSSDAHLWADYIELLCLFNTDGIISKSDLLDRVRDRADLGGELEDIQSEIEEADNGINEGDEETEFSTAEIDDKWSLQVDDWFSHLNYRRGIFDDFYPFTLSDDLSLLSTQTDRTLRHTFYIFLLLSSGLEHFRQHTNLFTFGFEAMCLEGLKHFLPESANIHMFSRNRLSDRRYAGNLWGKINKLAEDIKDRVILPGNEFAPTDTADNGLDVVGWIPFHKDDPCDRLLMIFSQCACGKDWPRKYSESSVANWGTVLELKAPPVNMVFIPYCFRKADGTWYKEHDIRLGYILIDRPRLIHILQEKYLSFQNQPSYSIVTNLLQQQESLF